MLPAAAEAGIVTHWNAPLRPSLRTQVGRLYAIL
jgi:hypothetical protein